MTYEDFLYSLSSDQQAAIVADYRSLRHDHCPPVQAMTSAIDALLYEELPIEGTPSASTIDRLYTISKAVMDGKYANLSEALSAFSSDLNPDPNKEPAL